MLFIGIENINILFIYKMQFELKLKNKTKLIPQIEIENTRFDSRVLSNDLMDKKMDLLLQ